MRDDHHSRAARFRQLNGGTQCLLAIGVEIGVRLIQQDQFSIAKERTGKTDTLALTTGKLVAIAPYFGLVAGRQRQNHLMRLREHGRGHDVLVPRMFVKAGDGFGHGAAQKLHVLRKIADKLPELVGVPVMAGLRRPAGSCRRSAVPAPPSGAARSIFRRQSGR